MSSVLEMLSSIVPSPVLQVECALSKVIPIPFGFLEVFLAFLQDVKCFSIPRLFV